MDMAGRDSQKYTPKTVDSSRVVCSKNFVGIGVSIANSIEVCEYYAEI
jgi:hypothetical protein